MYKYFFVKKNIWVILKNYSKNFVHSNGNIAEIRMPCAHTENIVGIKNGRKRLFFIKN